MTDRLRIDRGAVQSHSDETNRNLGGFRTSADNVDRQQSYQQQMAEGGVGDQELGAVRSSTRHLTEDVHASSTKLNSRTNENADEFIKNVANAASKNLRA